MPRKMIYFGILLALSAFSGRHTCIISFSPPFLFHLRSVNVGRPLKWCTINERSHPKCMEQETRAWMGRWMEQSRTNVARCAAPLVEWVNHSHGACECWGFRLSVLFFNFSAALPHSIWKWANLMYIYSSLRNVHFNWNLSKFRERFIRAH